LTPYTPPSGTYDAPFTWVFDGSGLTDGSNALNQIVSVYAGYGDFVMRRVVGLQNVLNAAGGQFQIYDASLDVLQHVPLNFQAANSPYDSAIIPEELYQENSRIQLDLYKVLRNITNGVSQAFVGFQGIRRKPGKRIQPNYNYFPKTLTYTVQATVNQLGAANILNQAPIAVFQTIDNYDFDLSQIILTASSAGGAVPLPCVGMNIYDSDKQIISNLPVLDTWVNGAPKSAYKNGAIVPPLFFPMTSQLRVDLYSLISNGALLPVTVTIHFVGQWRIPCS
jgi:hypothetical protein